MKDQKSLMIERILRINDNELNNYGIVCQDIEGLLEKAVFLSIKYNFTKKQISLTK